MTRIPTYISDDKIGGGLPTGTGQAVARPEDFGAGAAMAQANIGVAQQQQGAALMSVGQSAGALAGAFQLRQNKLDEANGVGTFDFSKTFTELQVSTKDPKELQQNVANAYDDAINKHIDGLDTNDVVRANIRKTLMLQRPSYMSQAANIAMKTADARDKINTNDALNVQQNTVSTNGSIEAYQTATERSNAIIDAQPGVSEVEKLGMKQASRYNLGKRRFEGLIRDNEDDAAGLQGIENELKEGDFWKRNLSGQDYDRLLDTIDRQKKAANSGVVAAGRTAITSVRERNTNGDVIDPVELSAATAAVTASGKPELMSQMAMINKQQSIYRDGKSLPISEMRAQREKTLTAKGVSALPEPVKQGISEGTTATNGSISNEYLAGLVNAEYGGQVASGDYGQGTGSKTSDGKIGSDAVGIAQFTSGTFLDVVRNHGSELGIQPGMSRDAILALRKDPVLSLKAAALHAKDNKDKLEGELGRNVTDGDLYFAHFLGVAGARRFLTAADASPKALATASVSSEQVDANRNVFFDNGKPRTNEQVRAYMTNAMMNGPSRVDYSAVKAWDKVIGNTEKALKDDPMTFARGVQRFSDIGDVSTPEGMGQRGIAAQTVAEYYGVPTKDFKPFTKEEVEGFAKTVRDGSADEKIGMLSKIAGLGGEMAKAGFKQVGSKDSVFGYAAGLAYSGGQMGVASDILRGETRIKEDKDVLNTIGAQDTDISAAFYKYVDKSLINTDRGTEIRKAAVAHYVEVQMARGSARTGKFDPDLFQKSIDAVLGAAPGGKPVDKINGATTMLPQGISKETFTTGLDRMTTDDYSRLSKWGGPPLYADGSAVKPQDIANEGQFEAIGGGEYRVKMGDGSYLMSGTATLPDGKKRGVPYIFRGDPAAITEFSLRQKTAPVPPPNYVPKPPAPPRRIE